MLETHEIKSIAYKGPVLASDIYGNLGYREFVDLDLLIKLEDFVVTKKLLLKNGYKSELNLQDHQERLLFRTRCEYVFIHETKNIYLEIHWLTVPKYFAKLKNFNSYFERTEFCTIGGQPVCSLPPEELLLVLSVHGAKHLWHSLKWLCDVDQLIRKKPNLNWEKVFTEAEESNIGRMLLTNLQLCHSLLNTPIPDDILEECKQDKIVRELNTVIATFLCRKLTEYPSKFRSLFLHTTLIEGIPDKIRFIVGTTFSLTEKDLKLFDLPNPLHSLYYPLRLINLLRAYGSKLL